MDAEYIVSLRNHLVFIRENMSAEYKIACGNSCGDNVMNRLSDTIVILDGLIRDLEQRRGH